LENRRTEQVLRGKEGGDLYQCGGEVGKGCGRVNILCRYCVHMHVNTKKISVETIPGIRGEEDKGE
jgi:hypothetical protein